MYKLDKEIGKGLYYINTFLWVLISLIGFSTVLYGYLMFVAFVLNIGEIDAQFDFTPLYTIFSFISVVLVLGAIQEYMKRKATEGLTKKQAKVLFEVGLTIGETMSAFGSDNIYYTMDEDQLIVALPDTYRDYRISLGVIFSEEFNRGLSILEDAVNDGVFGKVIVWNYSQFSDRDICIELTKEGVKNNLIDAQYAHKNGYDCISYESSKQYTITKRRTAGMTVKRV